ncbi:hypothetical protein CPB83DRAFT_852853 [Crepidotus variabilis]|uniref:Uncharacterized protein n=1 Tax=Crepidotus variabilis TaxID=179855 RepID=A0A9P6JQY2_9AGAR|nr:hypothetical protein CPB83DRAFT_852853 [Crepidotus variabilis]
MADVEKLKCRCGEPAARKVSSTNKRVYYGCARRQTSLRQQCDFYYQPPVPIAPEKASSPSSSITQEAHSVGPNPLPSTPTAESPIKRTHSKVDEDSEPRLPHSQKRTKVILSASHESTILEPPLTPSQKRTKIIAAALTGSPIPELDKSEALPRHSFSIPSPSLSDHLALLDEAGASDLAAGSQNQVPTESSQDLRSDILGIEDASLSQQRQACSSQTVAVSDNGSGDTCLVNDEEQRFGVTNANESRWIHGRPASMRSTNLVAESRFRDLGPASPSPLPGTKGKQKATNYADTDMPVGDRTKVFQYLPSDENPSTAQRPQYSAATIANMLAPLEGIPGYVSRLEKSNQIKDMRIKHLENEVDRLRARQEELEKILDMYQ